MSDPRAVRPNWPAVVFGGLWLLAAAIKLAGGPGTAYDWWFIGFVLAGGVAFTAGGLGPALGLRSARWARRACGAGLAVATAAAVVDVYLRGWASQGWMWLAVLGTAILAWAVSAARRPAVGGAGRGSDAEPGAAPDRGRKAGPGR
ncbi:MAG: hypothetical protein K2X87_26340 [Gemmataceae bacterium]|nr:hypothetical protein [Gemmataceae bacterium]